MQHVDDGRLQAWVDRERSGLADDERAEIEGHLAGCASCAARADEMAEIDRRSHEILTAAEREPAQMPDFAEIRSRARSLEPTRARPRAWRAGAWAASVVLAVGLGWAMNDLLDGGALGDQTIAPPAGPRAVAESAAEPLAARQRVSARPDGPIDAEESPESPFADALDVDDATAGAQTIVAAAPPPADAALAEERSEMSERSEVSELPEVAEPVATAEPSAPAVDRDQAVAAARGLAPAPNVPTLPTEPIGGSRAAPALTTNALADALARRVGVPSEDRMLFGRVEDEDGTPLQGVQVVVGRDGTLTAADGTFALLLDSSQVGQADSVIFERIGYAKVTHGLDAWQDDRIAVDAKMTAVALALDELVVTGAATAENDGALPLGQGSWTAIANDSVSPAGFPVRRLPDAPIETLELATFGSRTAERVTQSLPDGTRVVVWQARGPILLASSDLPAGHTVVHGTVGEVSVAVSGPLDPARLQAVLREVR